MFLPLKLNLVWREDQKNIENLKNNGVLEFYMTYKIFLFIPTRSRSFT